MAIACLQAFVSVAAPVGTQIRTAMAAPCGNTMRFAPPMNVPSVPGLQYQPPAAGVGSHFIVVQVPVLPVMLRPQQLDLTFRVESGSFVGKELLFFVELNGRE